jgi:hypothetical protein
LQNGLIKSCSSSEDLSEYKIPWFYVDWRKFCIHLNSLNVRHFGKVAATASKLWRRGYLKWRDVPAEFHKYLLPGSLVGSGDSHTDTDMMVISLAYIFTLERKVG